MSTGNAHKIEEVKEILGPEFNILSLADLHNAPSIDETGSSYAENARIKAKSLWEIVREPVFADDSGLEVDFLEGRPGIHSMRFSGPNATHAKNIEKLLEILSEVPMQKRSARFRCTVIYLDKLGIETSFQGTMEGSIAFAAEGSGGFGYDPVFFVPSRGCTAAMLPDGVKNEISHRAKAIMAMKDYLSSLRADIAS